MRPWGESSRYDVGVEWEERYMRVQVKSTIYKVGHAWVCNTRPDNDYRPYTVRQIDFLAAYVIPASCPTRHAGMASNFKTKVKSGGQECPPHTCETYFASVTCSRDSL